MITVQTVSRPYVLYIGPFQMLTSAETAQNMIDSAVVIRATAGRCVCQDDDGSRFVITPATRGGGPAFVVGREV